jgi:hypothetical protein
MLEMLVGAALRSLLLAAAVGLGLRVCRTRDPHVRLMAWKVVLVASLLMPATTRLAASAFPAIAFPVSRITPMVPFVADAPVEVAPRHQNATSVDTNAHLDQYKSAAPTAGLHHDIRHIHRSTDRRAHAVLQDHAVSDSRS